jgi:glycosyltransferase involved in cell wall biosynthesis
MASPLTVSVVLPTFNRRRRLERVLAGLEQQSLLAEGFEVVVINDGSSDDTEAWLGANQRRPFKLNAIHQRNAGPANARNAGVAAAQGSLILFIDDDVEPTRDLVSEHLASHEAEQDVVVMGPLASLPHYSQPWVAWEQAKLELQYGAMVRGDWEPTFRQFWTGNASVERRHVLEAGGFDATYNRAEDVELGRRLHERGLRFRYNPRARGLHHAERSLAAWEAMHDSYGALEVKIFGEQGDQNLVKALGENFSRVHPATRWLVGHCVGHPLRYSLARSVLHRILVVEEAVGVPAASGQICGALANLIYWEASARALGERPIRDVFQRGDELRQRGGTP